MAIALALATPAYAASSNTITVGFTVLTQSRNDLWRDDVNKAGGIKLRNKQYKIKFADYDDQSQPARVQQLYSRLLLQDKADFLFSPYSSGLTATAAVPLGNMARSC